MDDEGGRCSTRARMYVRVHVFNTRRVCIGLFWMDSSARLASVSCAAGAWSGNAVSSVQEEEEESKSFPSSRPCIDLCFHYMAPLYGSSFMLPCLLLFIFYYTPSLEGRVILCKSAQAPSNERSLIDLLYLQDVSLGEWRGVRGPSGISYHFLSFFF